MNEKIKLKCFDYTFEGLGVCRHDDMVVFVKDMLIGEVCLVEIIDTKKRFKIGKVIEVITPSQSRVTPICKHYEACGGCQIQHFSKDEQNLFKKGLFKKFKSDSVNYIPAQTCLKYRNKVTIHLKKTDKWIAGFNQHRTHDIFNLDQCYLISDTMNIVYKAILDVFNDLNLENGIDKLVIKESEANNDMMLIFIGESEPSNFDDVIGLITKQFLQIKSIYFYTGANTNKPLYSLKKRLVFGNDTITDQILGKSFIISPESFFQVNRYQTDLLYQSILDLADFQGSESILELYCGVGTISICIAHQVKHITAIEIVENAIDDAKQNAKINNINNIDFICQNANQLKRQLDKQDDLSEMPSYDYLIVDPPRKGLEQDLIDYILKTTPDKIIYVSCDINSQIRDIRKLEQHYKIEKISGCDMFGQSFHVETVVLMSRVEK